MTKEKSKKVLKYISIFLVVFILGGAILPYIKQKDVSDDFAKQVESYFGKSDATSVDRATLVENTVDAFDSRYQLIASSEETLDFAYHTMQIGESTDVLFAEIYKAADRGVAVRIYLDGKAGAMSSNIKSRLKAMSAHPNIQVKYYNPINIFKPWQLQSLLHDKFIIADDQYLLLGGRNIGDRYYEPKGYTGNVAEDRDVLVWNTGENVEDSVISQAKDYMDLLWNYENTKSLKGKESNSLINEMIALEESFKKDNPKFFTRDLDSFKDETVATNGVHLVHNPINSGSKEPWVGYFLGRLADKAESSVLIQTPYSTGNKKLLERLTENAQEKEMVMLTNSIGSTPNFPAFSNYYSNRKKFVATGVEIYEYQSTNSIHGKSMVFDDRISAVGSFNLDDRSFYLSTETMLIIDSPEFAEILTGAIEDFMGSSLKVMPDNTYEKNEHVAEIEASFFKKAMLWVVSIFSRVFQFLI